MSGVLWSNNVLLHACLAVDDCFMPGDTIPPNQPDSVAFIQGKSNGEAKNQ